MSETKPTNPKDAIGSEKIPLHLWPMSATALGCMGLADGMLKYGRSNWREAGVRASIYYDAVMRHLAAWFEGEDVDPDSGLPHLAHALACLAIVVDADTQGKLVDDRQYGDPTAWRRWVELLTPHVGRLKQKHAERKVTHYSRERHQLREEIQKTVVEAVVPNAKDHVRREAIYNPVPDPWPKCSFGHGSCDQPARNADGLRYCVDHARAAGVIK